MRWLVLITVLVTALFFAFPGTDLAVSSYFYSVENNTFPLLHHPALVASYYLVYIATWGTVALLLGLIGLHLFRERWPRLQRVRIYSRRQVAYLLIAVAIGPGMLVHWGMKEFYGRARPLNVEQFGGSDVYTPPFVVSPAGGKSFVSGHSAMAFWFTAFGLVVAAGKRRKQLYVAGCTFGFLAAAARVMQGKHYLSDVMFGALLVLLLNHALAWWLFRKRAQETVPERKSENL